MESDNSVEMNSVVCLLGELWMMVVDFLAQSHDLQLKAPYIECSGIVSPPEPAFNRLRK